jgi:hypothetical protein
LQQLEAFISVGGAEFNRCLREWKDKPDAFLLQIMENQKTGEQYEAAMVLWRERQVIEERDHHKEMLSKQDETISVARLNLWWARFLGALGVIIALLGLGITVWMQWKPTTSASALTPSSSPATPPTISPVFEKGIGSPSNTPQPKPPSAPATRLRQSSP